jgi:regulator of protease activity HflC (stomatin/prohibitin superfamily)
MTNIRTVMGSMDLDELLSNRDVINAKLLEVVDAATETWGVKVTRIEIKDIEPPRDIVDSMARQMKAERDKRAQILEAQGSRESAILKAEGEKQAAVLEAEGRREAAFKDAEARERQAEAEAKATQMVSEAIRDGNVQAINYFVANNYMKALEGIAKSPNQKILMMPLEASSVIGSLAGVAEIASEAFGKKPSGSAGANGSTSTPPRTPPVNPTASSNPWGNS